MLYHYLVTTKAGNQEFYTMKEARDYASAFGGVVYLVMGNGDSARL